MGKKSLRFGLFGALLCFLCGCESITGFLDGLSRPRELPEVDVAPVYVGDGPRIRIGVGLVVQVGVSGQQMHSMDVLVDQNGEATLPYLLTAPVKCDGLSLDAFRQKLCKLYQEFIRQPQVTVRFAPFGRDGVSPYGTVNVLGQVSNPGPVNMPSTMDLTVTKALQAAGGLKQFADKRKVQVSRREKDGSIVKTFIDLEEIGREGRMDKDMELKAGDVVYAHETYW